jgi:hypothetical protein
MYSVVWLSKTGKQDKVSKHALKNGIYMYYLQNDVIDSAAKHALVISIAEYSSREFLSIAK